MLRRVLVGVLAAGALCCHESPGRTQSPDDAENSQIPAEELPFRESAQAYLDAYAKRDAKAIGELFTEDAEFIDEFGVRTEGRESIVAMFEKVFDNAKEASIDEIIIERIRRISETVALEEGVVVAQEDPTAPRFACRYIALHKKGDDGKWRINTLKDFPREGSERQEQLSQLEWMTGEWVSQDSNSVVHTECRWSEDGNYLLRRFTAQTFDGREIDGVQRIGWDPARNTLRSWTFDSDGGFFSGLWTKQGDQWLLTKTGVTADGESVTATEAYLLVDHEKYQWHYRDLLVDGESFGEGEPVTMVRRPPEPAQK